MDPIARRDSIWVAVYSATFTNLRANNVAAFEAAKGAADDADFAVAMVSKFIHDGPGAFEAAT